MIWLALLNCFCLARANVVFEGFYRIEKNREHIGYLVQQLSQDPTTGKKTLRTFNRTQREGKRFFEFSKIESEAGLKSLSSLFATDKDAAPYQIEVNYDQGQATAKTYSYPAHQLRQSNREVAPPIFGAMVLFAIPYRRLKSNVEYEFRAYAEERARPAVGTLTPLGEKREGNVTIFQVVTDYLGLYTESFVNEAGLPLGARLLAEGTLCFWVADRKHAVGDLAFDEGEIKKLFGGAIPEGKLSPWTGIKDAQAVMQKFVPPPRRIAALPDQKYPPLPMGVK